MDRGEQLKIDGLDRVATSNAEWLTWIRKHARYTCHKQGTVSADDLRTIADRHNRHPHHPNAWGAVFRGSEWELTGYKKSRYVSNHARRIAVWRLKWN